MCGDAHRASYPVFQFVERVQIESSVTYHRHSSAEFTERAVGTFALHYARKVRPQIERPFVAGLSFAAFCKNAESFVL